MIEYINTQELKIEDFINKIKYLKSNLKDDYISKIIAEPKYDLYDEFVYKYTTDEIIAYKPKGSGFWIENTKNDLILVETHLEQKDFIIKELSIEKGINHATTMVNKWYNDYSSFVYDKSTSDILFSKSRFRGTWEENLPNLMKYKPHL